MARGKYHEWITDDGLLIIFGWARDGLTDKQISKNIGINENTFLRWKEQFPQIVQTLKKGRRPVDIEVENALLKSALGFSVLVKKPVKVKEVRYEDKHRVEEEKIVYADEEVYIPPSNTAQIFWLKNRKVERWRDRPQPSQATAVQDDGFIDALKASAEVDWEEEDGTEQE